jgi:DNA-directed RNA polymerase specialized sigma24 family protein
MINMSLDFVGAYQDTAIELKVLELREKELRKRVELAHAVLTTGKAPSSGRDFCHVPMDRAIETYNREVDALREAQEAVDSKREVLRQMDEQLSKFTGLAHQIAYLRMVRGMKLVDIAEELGYSYSNIRVIASRNKIAI